MCSAGPAPTSAPPTLSRRSALHGLVLLGLPSAAIAKEKKAAKAPALETSETMSLDEFYAALEDQEVLKVEFDGPKFEKCFVFMKDGGEYLISEGYPKESSVSSAGPQSVIGKIKNEIKSGNPVTWSWRGADAFKKFAKKDVKVDKAEGNLSAEVAKRQAEKKEGGLFGLSLPAPPKSLAQKAQPAAEEDEE